MRKLYSHGPVPASQINGGQPNTQAGVEGGAACRAMLSISASRKIFSRGLYLAVIEMNTKDGAKESREDAGSRRQTGELSWEGGCEVYVSNPFASEACRGGNAQL